MTQIHPQDPEERFRRIAIEAIHAFERNPRRIRNPEYDRIKHSIRARGLEQPLIVTVRPGEASYVVHAGGNTRLAVVKELFSETGDARFATIDCVVTPWQADAATLLAHLRENEMRGELSFIDRARAIVDWQCLFESETGKRLSQRQLAAKLSTEGYSISQALISHMVYAVEVLLPALPQAFAAGLGRRQVERVRALERSGRAVWRIHRLGSQAAFMGVFVALCQRSDAADWSFDALRSALEVELADGAEVGLQAVRVAIENALGTSLGLADSDESSIVMEEAEPTDAMGSSQPMPVAVPGGRDDARSENPHQATSEPEVEGHLPPVAEKMADNRIAAICLEAETDRPVTALDPTALDDVQQLREQAWRLAESLAQRHGLGGLIKPLIDRASGYLLIDVPDATLAESLDDVRLGEIALLWWHLAACAELTMAPVEAVTPLMPADSTLRQILETGDAERLYRCVPMLDPAQMGDLLWRRLAERDWQDLIQLMSTYRRLRALAMQPTGTLWS